MSDSPYRKPGERLWTIGDASGDRVTPSNLDAYQRWEAALAEEVAFWDGVIRTGGDWPDEIRERLDPESPLQAELRALLIDCGSRLDILDVGAGPFTTVGKKWDGHDVHITAIDPLAEHYRMLLDRYSVHPSVPTVAGSGETVERDYGADVFDLAYARNSLDHSHDPVKAIQGMLDVVKPGGWVVLEHVQRVADKEGHAGLHQHNFFCAGCPVDTDVAELFIETGGKTVNVNHALDGQDHAGIVTVRNDWVLAKFRKRKR